MSQTGRFPWVQAKLVARTGTGHTPSRSRPEYWIPDELTIPWVTLADVHQLRSGARDTIRETAEKISKRGIENSSAVVHSRGTVILSRTASVGYAGRMGTDMAVSQDFMTWTPGPRLNGQFMLHVLRGIRPQLLRLMHGSTHKTIYMPDLLAISIPLPPLDEQRRIADFLDREFARIGALTAALRRSSANANQLLSEAAGAMILDASFPPRRIGYDYSIVSGKTLNAALENDDVHTLTAFIGTGHVRWGYVADMPFKFARFSKHECAALDLRCGDLLVNEGGAGSGRSAVLRQDLPNVSFQNHVHRLRTLGEVNPEYTRLAIQASHARGELLLDSLGIGLPNLSKSRLRNLRVPTPPKAQQDAVVARLLRLESAATALTARVGRMLGLADEYRQALALRAVTGKIDPAQFSDAQMEESLHAASEGERPEALSS